MVSFKKAFLTDNKRFNSFATTTKQYETESFNDLTVTILTIFNPGREDKASNVSSTVHVKFDYGLDVVKLP